MAMTELQNSEFKIFCHKDGLSPSGTDAHYWQEARPLGILPAIWAVHHHEMPTGAKLEELQALEPYAQPLLPMEDTGPVTGGYLTAQEVAAELDVTLARVRQLVSDGRFEPVETIFGRFFRPQEVEEYRTSLRQSPGRPLKEGSEWPDQSTTEAPGTASA